MSDAAPARRCDWRLMIPIWQAISTRSYIFVTVGSLRGARTGFAILFVLGVIGMLAPVASANPFISVDMYIVVVPILLVLLNYPFNGLMLYGMYRLTLRESHAPRPRSVRIFVSDFVAAVLLFTLLGALIDYLVWMGYAFGYSELIFVEVIGGLVAIGVTCYIVCSRYLFMAREGAIPASIVVVLVNLISWGFLVGSPIDIFAYVCIPVVTACWILLEVLLVLNMAQHRGRLAARTPEATSVALDDDLVLRPEGRAAPAPTKRWRLRMELLTANVVLMTVLLVISLGMIAMGVWE